MVAAVLAALVVSDGRAPAQTTGEGALAEVSRQPGGPELLGVLSLGLLAYAGWRLVQAVFAVERSEGDRPSLMQRLGWLGIAVVYASLLARAISLLAGSGGSGGASNHPRAYAAKALAWPAGPYLVGAVGIGLVAGGVSLAIWSLLHDFDEDLETDRMPTWFRIGARVSAVFGNLTRAALVVLVGVYLEMGAVEDTPVKVKSLDQVLETIMRQPAGAYLVALFAAGLASFALFSLVEARYREV